MKNTEIIDILTDERKSPTEQFWDANEKMRKSARILVDRLDGHSRSGMWEYLSLMYRHGLIRDADLEEFSEPLRQQVLRWIEICGGRR